MGIKTEFVELLREGIKKAGGKTKLAKALEIRNQTVTSWCCGASPRLENMEKLIQYLEQGRKRGTRK